MVVVHTLNAIYAVMIANAFLSFHNHLQILIQLRRNISYVKLSMLHPHT